MDFLLLFIGPWIYLDFIESGTFSGSHQEEDEKNTCIYKQVVLQGLPRIRHDPSPTPKRSLSSLYNYSRRILPNTVFLNSVLCMISVQMVLFDPGGFFWKKKNNFKHYRYLPYLWQLETTKGVGCCIWWILSLFLYVCSRSSCFTVHFYQTKRVLLVFWGEWGPFP